MCDTMRTSRLRRVVMKMPRDLLNPMTIAFALAATFEFWFFDRLWQVFVACLCWWIFFGAGIANNALWDRTPKVQHATDREMRKLLLLSILLGPFAERIFKH